MTTTTSVFSGLSTPAYSNSGDQNVIISGRIQPAAAGRSVSLYSENADGSTNAYVTGAVTDANGYFSMVTNVQVVTSYHLYSGKQVVGANTYTSAITAGFSIRSLRFWEPFDYTDAAAMLASGKWALRQNTYPTSGGRQNARSDASALEVSGGQLKMKILPDPDQVTNPGKVLEGHITAGVLPVVYGHIEARIKFERPKGAHGALWHTSGYGAGQAELDVVEFFGERGPVKAAPADVWSQKVQHTVWKGDANGTPVVDDFRNSWTTANPYTSQAGTANVEQNNDDAWWTEFHTFEAQWIASGYTFLIDGVSVGKVASAAATEPGELILSLLCSDSEHDDLTANINAGTYAYGDYLMTVDWVRVWR